MERFSQRESILLGHHHHRQQNNPVSSPRRNSDIDFSDVFGGPPRRASLQETRYSFDESSTEIRRASNDYQEDDGGDGDINGGETAGVRDRLSGLNEKPVLGDPEGRVNRRRYPSEDFFDDIFKGDDYSLSSSPRKHERNSSSAPGSRVLSPVRPFPPRAEPLGGSSFPAQFSLPARLMKGTELPTFGSGNRNQQKSKDSDSNGVSNYSCSPLSRFSSQANQIREGLENNVQFRSYLSKELSLGGEGSFDLGKSVDEEKISNLERHISALDSDGPEVQDKGNQFHFSIYKWASKGAPLAMPLRGRKSLQEKSKFERSASYNGWLRGENMAKGSPKVNLRNQDFPSFNTSLSSTAERFGMELDKQKDGSFADTAKGGVEKPIRLTRQIFVHQSQNP